MLHSSYPMSWAQKLLCLNFIFSYTIETAVRCFSLNLLIKTLGADQLGKYFATSAILSIILILSSLYFSKKFSPLIRFLFVHAFLIGLALASLSAPSVQIQAQILFLAIMGFDLITYFSRWSITGHFVTPFESKRIFPILSTFGESGVFLGALFAMASLFGLEKIHYLWSWLLAESSIFGIGFLLWLQTKKERSPLHQETRIEKKQPSVTLLTLLRRYQLVPFLALWVLIWGILYTSVATLTGATFDHSGLNLTVLYGCLSLGTALLAALNATLLYPALLRWFRLGAMLIISSSLAILIGGPYLFFNFFVMALVAYVFFELINTSFAVLAISTEFGLYPAVHRDRIRLLGEILALSAGSSLVGPIFTLPKFIIPWVLIALLLFLFVLSFLTQNSYKKELFQFLKGTEEEEKENAIALFDLLEEEDGYQKILSILKSDPSLPVRLNVINTFVALGDEKPAPHLFRLLQDNSEEPLKIAVLRYFDSVPLEKLDPFLRHQFFEILKRLSISQSSNILRAMSVRLWVTKAPLENSVPFILERLQDKDERVVANAIEGLNEVHYPGVVTLLKSYCSHPVPRIRANTIIALWKYQEVAEEVRAALRKMVGSSQLGEQMSGIWAVGEVQDHSQKEFLKSLLDSKDPELQRNVPMTLIKLGDKSVVPKIVDMILESEAKQAINVCYLSLRLPTEVLNEWIIASIYERGEAARRKAIYYYSQCGGFCREQIELLSGKKEKALLS